MKEMMMRLGKILAPGAVCLLLMTPVSSGWSAPAKRAGEKAAKAKTEQAAPAQPALRNFELATIKSTFTVPTTIKEGRNPFFPAAQVSGTVPEEKQPTIETSAFVLNGITGPPLRSAMINGRTFLTGEQGEVRLQNGAKVLIKCSEIRDESATIVVGGVSRELKLRFGI